MYELESVEAAAHAGFVFGLQVALRDDNIQRPAFQPLFERLEAIAKGTETLVHRDGLGEFHETYNKMFSEEQRDQKEFARMICRYYSKLTGLPLPFED